MKGCIRIQSISHPWTATHFFFNVSLLSESFVFFMVNLVPGSSSVTAILSGPVEHSGHESYHYSQAIQFIVRLYSKSRAYLSCRSIAEHEVWGILDPLLRSSLENIEALAGGTSLSLMRKFDCEQFEVKLM